MLTEALAQIGPLMHRALHPSGPLPRPTSRSTSPLMFVSRSVDRLPLPTELSKAGIDYWRSLTLSTPAAWYVLTVRPPTIHHQQTTILLHWDEDLVGCIASLDADIASLLCITPQPRDGLEDGWRSINVAEVWLGVELDQHEQRCIVLVSNTGQEHTGDFADSQTRVLKTKMVARINPIPAGS